MARLYTQYKSKILFELQEKLNVNPMAVPKIEKITLNMGVGMAKNNKHLLEQSRQDLELIAGQRAIITKAKKSIAGFKIRTGFPIGVKVTLRRERMYEFLDRLISLALPRVRDFRGLSLKSFDGKGNYSLGIKEHIAFTEIDFSKIDLIKGLNITITTSAKTDKEALLLLNSFGFPFREK